MFTTTLIYAGLLPLAVSAVITLVLRQLHVSSRATWAWGVACGFIAGLFALKSQSSGFAAALYSFWQPHEAADWLPIIVALALGVSILLMAARPSLWRPMIVLAVAFAIAVPLRLLNGNVRLINGQWSAFDKLGYLTLLTTALGFLWLLLATGGGEQKSSAQLLLVVMVAVGCAAVLTLSGVLVYGQFCGVVAAALTGTALAVFSGATGSASASPRFSLAGFNGAAGIITFSLGSLIILGYFFADLGALNAALLLVSLVAAGTPFPMAFLRRPVWQRFAARAIACLLPLTIAIVSAAK